MLLAFHHITYIIPEGSAAGTHFSADNSYPWAGLSCRGASEL